MNAPFENLAELATERALITTSAHTLSWDQETYLPAQAHAWRAKQEAWLSRRAHEIATSDDWRRHLEDATAADDGSSPVLTANLREMRRQFELATRLPAELVERLSETTSLSKNAWIEARKKSDFSLFSAHLRKVLGLVKEQAELWGYPDQPYDALLDSHERGATTRSVSAVFDALRPELVTLAADAVARSARQPISLPPGPYPIAAQRRFNQQVASALGFDFEAGRIDTTTHPFCTTLGPEDVRLTTRYEEHDFTSSLFGVMHEAGHGLYEQGLPSTDFGLPSGEAVSLGIHESQSRLWENHVGRSRPFWEHWYPVAIEHFPALRDFSLDDFMRFIHRAEFTCIRVEADEATYDLHILLRFEIEQLLIRDEIQIEDLPTVWNERFQDTFGLTPADDAQGCLQDIHWPMGAFGYFPTYTLGNLHAAQLFNTALADPSIAKAFTAADYAPLLAWLRQSIHQPGGTLDPSELIQKATGSAPSPTAHLAHLRSRYL